jgi:hypothetical protein
LPLLKALEDLLGYFEGYETDYNEVIPEFERARNIIAKIYG